MRRLAPLLLILLAHCSWPMEPPRGVMSSPVSDRHGWGQTSGLEVT